MKLQSEVSGCGRRVDLAETLQLSPVVVALHALKCIHQGIEISPGKLTVLLPLHGAGVWSQRRKSKIVIDKLRVISGKKYSEIM